MLFYWKNDGHSFASVPFHSNSPRYNTPKLHRSTRSLYAFLVSFREMAGEFFIAPDFGGQKNRLKYRKSSPQLIEMRSTLPETNSQFAPENGPLHPKRKPDRLPSTNFQVFLRAVSFREGNRKKEEIHQAKMRGISGFRIFPNPKRTLKKIPVKL